MNKLTKYLKETAKYALRSRPVIHRYIREVERLYRMTPEELRQRNEQRFLEIFRRAYDRSPFYHRLYSEAGIRRDDITSLDDIAKLPIITKEMVKQHADEMLTVPRRRVIGAHTSGTTGTPLKVYEDWPSIYYEQAYTYCSRRRNGFTYGQPIVSLRGFLDKSITHLKIHISNTLYLSSYNINPDTVRLYYDLIRKHRPVAIEGYPSSLYSLALMLKDAGLTLTIPVAFTSSETLLGHQRSIIEKQLGTEIFDNYGMTERTICLLETFNHNGYYEAPGYSINEYVEDGEICTSLINTSFPLIRYRSNDVMEIVEATEDNPQIVVKSIDGRSEDFLTCKDGSRIMRLDFIFKGVKHVKNSQLIVEKNGLLRVRIVPEADFTNADKAQVEQNLIDRTGRDNLDYAVELIESKDILLTPRGKFKFIVNLTNVKTGGVIRSVIGRVDDIIECKDGSLMQRIDFAEDANHVKACQWVQNKPGEITILIVPDDGFTSADLDYVVMRTEERVGKGNLDITAKVVEIDQLIYSRRGKFKLIVNQTRSAKSNGSLSLIGAYYGNAGNIKGADNGARMLKPFIAKSCSAIDGGDAEILQNPDLCGEECIDEVVDVCSQLKTLVRKSLYSGCSTLIFGGDHSISLGSISAAAEFAAGKSQNFGVIYIDAHGDINTLEKSITKNIHGTSLAACMGFGEPKMTEVATVPLNPANLLFIGTRSLDTAEVQLIKQQHIAVVAADEINKSVVEVGLESTIERVLSRVTTFMTEHSLQQIHLSVDIDAVDPQEAPGTGVPESDGLSGELVEHLIAGIAKMSETISADFVEFNPALDRDNRTSLLSAKLCEALAKGLTK